jgi:hypothetical protein
MVGDTSEVTFQYPRIYRAVLGFFFSRAGILLVFGFLFIWFAAALIAFCVMVMKLGSPVGSHILSAAIVFVLLLQALNVQQTVVALRFQPWRRIPMQITLTNGQIILFSSNRETERYPLSDLRAIQERRRLIRGRWWLPMPAESIKVTVSLQKPDYFYVFPALQGYDEFARAVGVAGQEHTGTIFRARPFVWVPSLAVIGWLCIVAADAWGRAIHAHWSSWPKPASGMWFGLAWGIVLLIFILLAMRRAPRIIQFMGNAATITWLLGSQTTIGPDDIVAIGDGQKEKLFASGQHIKIHLRCGTVYLYRTYFEDYAQIVERFRALARGVPTDDAI